MISDRSEMTEHLSPLKSGASVECVNPSLTTAVRKRDTITAVSEVPLTYGEE